MAYAIMGGLAVATVLTLIFLPACDLVPIKSPHPSTSQDKAVANDAIPIH